jgi:hypothetical protein
VGVLAAGGVILSPVRRKTHFRVGFDLAVDSDQGLGLIHP